MTNDYITLDGKKYSCPADKWESVPDKPVTVRRVLYDGSLDITYGPGDIKEWRGFIRAHNTPATGYGSKSDLMTTLNKKSEVSFTDHEGNSYTVACVGPFNEKSFTPDWGGSSNLWHVQVKLVKV